MRVAFLTSATPSDPCTNLHRAAAVLDAEATVASVQPLKDWSQLLDLPAESRPDLIAVTTPADAQSLKTLVSAGYHVLMEPPGLAPEDAEELGRAARQSSSIVAVAWLETAYPMVRAAMSLLRDKKLGAINSVRLENHQPRTAPRSTPGAMAALAPAAENLLSTITGLKLRAILAESALSPHTRAHDDAQVILRFEGHTRGQMTLSRTSTRPELAIAMQGESGCLAWTSRVPGELRYTPMGKPEQVLTPADLDPGSPAAEIIRQPGRQEGAVEALANLYRAAFESIRAKREGRARRSIGREFPTTVDLTRASRFTAAALESAQAGGVWAEL